MEEKRISTLTVIGMLKVTITLLFHYIFTPGDARGLKEYRQRKISS